jgi:hypothetical protein
MPFIVAAIVIGLIVVAAFALKWQRNRLQFSLMQAALEKGLTAMPGVPPVWIISLRQGVLSATLGVALFFVGAAVDHHASAVPMPAATTQAVAMEPVGPAGLPDQADLPAPAAGTPAAWDGPGPQGGPGPRGGFGPDGGPGMQRRGGMEREGGRDGGPGFGMGGGPDARPRPFGMNPALEQWHRAQDHIAVAEIAMGSGVVLLLLGIVRSIFAIVERKFSVV